MIGSKHCTHVLSTLVPALALCLASSTFASPASDKAVAVIDLPDDVSAPVIANIKIAARSYRMVVDTGAGNLLFHLPVAQRDFAAAPVNASQLAKAKGLYGDLDLHYFRVDKFSVGDWNVQAIADAAGLDMTQLVHQHGADGLIGVPYLARLDWHWDNRGGQLRGYERGSRTIADIRSRLHCQPLLDLDGTPGVAVRVRDQQAMFAIDTGDLGLSGGLNPEDREAMAYYGNIRASALESGQSDVAGRALPDLRISQIQGASLGPTRLDGLVLSEVQDYSRFGIGFLKKFDEVVLDFENGQFCTPAIARIAPDDMSRWRTTAP